MMDTQILGHVPASGNICDPLHATLYHLVYIFSQLTSDTLWMLRCNIFSQVAYFWDDVDATL